MGIHHGDWWCAACGGHNNWRDPSSVLVTQDSADPSEAMVFRAQAPPQAQCENLVCALKFLAIPQTGGNTLVDTIFECLQEQSRMNITSELRFIEVDNHEAVEIGDLEKNSEARWPGPSSTKSLPPNAVIREAVDELMVWGSWQIGTTTCGRRLACSLPRQSTHQVRTTCALARNQTTQPTRLQSGKRERAEEAVPP